MCTPLTPPPSVPKPITAGSACNIAPPAPNAISPTEYASSRSFALRYRLCCTFSLTSCKPSSTNSEPPAFNDVLAICPTVAPIPLSKVLIVLDVAPCRDFDIMDAGATLPTPLIMKRVDTNSIPVSTAANDMAYLYASSLEYTLLPCASRLFTNSKYLLPNDILYILYAISAPPPHLAPVAAPAPIPTPSVAKPPIAPPITAPTIAPLPPCFPVI